MTLSTVSDRWRCNARQCRQEIGLRKGTWLEWPRMEFRAVILFIYCWSKNVAKSNFCSEELSISHTTAVDWKNFLREVCTWRLFQTPTVIGGPGLHIEIDETLISHRKNHAGGVLPQQWIFGGICRETKQVFMYTVPDRTAANLMDTIQVCIAPGPIIISDMWASYQGIETVSDMNYTREMVNHTENCVDPTTGAHTLTIESLRHVYKMQNKRQCDTHRSLVDSYLCELVWRQKYRKTELLVQITNDISQFHPLQ
ncbi:hypothetical protein CLF_100748 [Clonorchis sinensis]|uniref:ISXO2-like transposase domain-containing protein n=1 Tax=Clonorchis sinensis TaxID=79923 RepID=G7Y457_CLOSI|nr:hypothetical protein CLF_100748 [Clonorchis sinensis]